MSHRLKYSEQYGTDLRLIIAYISAENPVAARQFANTLKAKTALIAHHPEIYQLRPELGEDIRIFMIFSYAIVYRISGADLLLERIVHASRDLLAILEVAED